MSWTTVDAGVVEVPEVMEVRGLPFSPLRYRLSAPSQPDAGWSDGQIAGP
jgi:hypothetical protein